MRNVLAHVSHTQKEAFAGDLKSIFAQPTRHLDDERVTAIVEQHRRTAGRAVSILEDGGPDTFS